MKNEKRFYVYAHRYKSGEKEGNIFYIGKGSGTRRYSNASRSAYWHNINNKYGRVTEILADGLSSLDACDLEMLLICEIGKENLCNISDGGDSGALGVSFSAERRAKLSEMMKIENKRRRAQEGWTHPCLRRKLSKKSLEKISASVKKRWSERDDEYRARISLKIRESLSRPESIALRSRINKEEKNPNYDHTIRKFKHKNGDFFVGTQYWFVKKYNINKGNVSSMVCGKRKTVSGWSVENVDS